MKRKPAAPTITEHDLQSRVIQWRDWKKGAYPHLAWLHSSTNGAKLPRRKNKNGQWYSPEAMKLKAEGMTSGIPDLFWPYPAHGYHGFYIECKRPGCLNEVRPGQADFMAYAEAHGYLCQVHDSDETIIEVLSWYGGIE